MDALNGKVVVVTGGAQGIGAALAQSLAAEGASILVSDINDTTDTVEQINASGGTAVGCYADVTDDDSLHAMVATAEESFGPVNVLVNNAGLFTTLDLKPFTEISDVEFDLVMKVNVRGVFQATKAVVPSMQKSDAGSIINIGSGTVHRGAPFYAHYVASKGAVLAMSRSLARELADSSIRVNCITVGFTASQGVLDNPQMIEKFRDFAVSARMLKRDMHPDDLCGTVNWLAGDGSDFVTGQVINVDGGAITY